jgi:hypothetical protein
MMNKVMNKSVTKQRGLTLISWLVIIIFLLFQAVIAMKVVPVYMTDAGVKSIIEDLPNDPKARVTPTSGLKDLVAKRLSMNSIYNIEPKDIKVRKNRDENIVTIEYEPRGNLFANLDYIITFKHEARIKAP